MIKKILIILTILLFTICLNSFNYKNYPETTLDEIVKIITEKEDHSEISGGFKIYNNFASFLYKLENYPKSFNNKYTEELYIYPGTLGIQANFIELFKYEIMLDYNKYKIVLLFQKQLIPYLKKEVKKGDEITLYVMYGIKKDLSNNILIFVSEFLTKKQKEEYFGTAAN
jgi:hypothetical protein